MWSVSFKNSARKSYRKQSSGIQFAIDYLVNELKVLGPVRGNWKNYSKLGKTKHHCHLKSGRPTYVACWEVVDKNKIEVYYVGTHERAPY